jgi:hypothetical protein
MVVGGGGGVTFSTENNRNNGNMKNNQMSFCEKDKGKSHGRTFKIKKRPMTLIFFLFNFNTVPTY